MISVNSNNRIQLVGHNSKGNQLIYFNDGKWYKLDDLGYKGFSESIVSNILMHSNIDNFVIYNEYEIDYNETLRKGCISDDFCKNGEEIVTVSKLFEQYYGKKVFLIFVKKTP